MREALATLARGEAVQPLRRALQMPDGSGVLVVMPGYLAPVQALGLKVITAFPGNQGTAFDSHQGAVLLFEPVHGSLVAVIDATAITAIRTAAVSGLATDLLALPSAGDLAVLGAGTQALTHIEAMQQVRTIRRCRIWNRTRASAHSLAELAARRFGMRVEVNATPREAVLDADIVCTTTAARDPIVEAGWLRPGAHLNVVGSASIRNREVDSKTVRRASVFVDSRESARNEAGDLLIPIEEGVIGEDHILAELGEVVLGKHPGRTSEEQITLFKSLGLAVEDLAAARHVYDEARRSGLGVEMKFGGSKK
jgi:ornithine cyclodeaminase